MKHLLTFVFISLIVSSCKKDEKEAQVATLENEVAKNVIEPVSKDMMETAIIYEANIRQYSPEGSFDAFTKDIPQLKQLGVKVIWLMPVFPISETKRKATGGKFASEFPENERKKYLGSYYAVTDFTKINPEFGDIEDFRSLVKTAHENDIYVILDWVPNHTGWDHEWLKSNPEYYTQNENGDVIHPEGTDWTDVADLNYDNKEMRKEMIEDMKHWIINENIDGFRCDVAGSVPTDFWKEAIPQLRAEKDLFMLAEAWEPELLKGNLFDMAYGWDTHHVMNHIAQGKENVEAWDKRMETINELYEDDDILMNFVTNHDENSWNGTIKERMGNGAELFTTLSYVAPGIPLIYSGMEYDMSHRLKFFEKDSIPKTKGEMWSVLNKLANLKSRSSALHGGKNAASYTRLENDNKNILSFTRSKNNTSITFLANMSNQQQTVSNMLNGKYQDYLTSTMETYDSSTSSITLQPWEYKILLH
ncbi:alpha-amylase family glycosyl hydrolase [Ichthyenterobacterium sp. W332]|uniref:Alpha-amylase family glycosyl hydrolase n=1 Tax=Microcosmobacter mediterraneus TaxID=3075607 RepID=A0ABU2YNT2_9FLAO|nr:alpha-amylase family glycosyl hydrolase [Ichthyenterobacterium sp. W332]MDT0558925.1 alpha-amylase family glycosyl hydrolase [Ichthyenterobacterium sp. W332]